MSMPDRRPFTTSLAAVMASIVALSLVTPTPDVDVALLRAEVHDVQLTTATTAQISTIAVSPAVRGTVAAAASTVAPTSAPAAATAPSPSADQVVPLAATATDIESTIEIIGGVGVGLLIAPIWYSLAPITIPLSLLAAYAGVTLAAGLSRLFCSGNITCLGPPPPPPTATDFLRAAAAFFLAAPFLAGGTNLVQFVSDAVGPWLQSVFPGIAAQATAAVSAAAPVTPKPVVNGLAARATTVNTVKAQTRPAASLLPTVAPKPTIAPKPLSFAVQGTLLVGKPQLSQSGSLRAADTSMTSNLSKTVKHPVGASSNTTENSTPRD
jgi:hypothetical protein